MSAYERFYLPKILRGFMQQGSRLPRSEELQHEGKVGFQNGTLETLDLLRF